MVRKAGIILTRNVNEDEQVYVVIQRFYPGYNQFLFLLEDIITSTGPNKLDVSHKPFLTTFKQDIIEMYGEDENDIYYEDLIYITDNIIKPFLILLLFKTTSSSNNSDPFYKTNYDILDIRYGFSSAISLPKGSIDKNDESPLNCAIREFEEETRLRIKSRTDIKKNKRLSNKYIEYYDISINNISNPKDVGLCEKYNETVSPATSGNGGEGNTITNFFITKINGNNHTLFNLDKMSELKEKYYREESIKRQFEIIDSGFINKNVLPHNSRLGSLSPDVKKIIDPDSKLIKARVRGLIASSGRSSNTFLPPGFGIGGSQKRLHKGGRIKNISKKNKKRTKNKSKKNKKV